MKNLFKNVVRSFKNNKISLIGLSFLVFFGVGSFCVLSNTTANITNEYNAVAEEGAIHDMTISELYDVGTPSYQNNSAGIIFTKSATDVSYEGFDTFWGEGEQPKVLANQLSALPGITESTATGTYFFPIPTQKLTTDEKTGKITCLRTYPITLDPTNSTGLYSSYAISGDPTLTHVELTITETFDNEGSIPTDVTNLQTLWGSGSKPSEWTTSQMATDLTSSVFARDFNTFNSLISNQSSIIYNAMMSSDTPMINYLKSFEYKDDLEFKRFQSVNITATTDPIFYKVIQNNPTDTIDKMVMFEDENHRLGNTLFDQNDFAPYNSQVVFYKSDKSQYIPHESVGRFVVPANFNEVASFELIPTSQFENLDLDEKSLYSQIMQIRFKRMATANNSKASYTALFKTLADKTKSWKEYETDFYESLKDEYAEYYSDYYLGASETVTFSANSNVVFTWTELIGTPQTCTISDWSARFAVINPQYLKASGKTVISPETFTTFKPFSEWYKKVYGKPYEGEITQSVAIEWLNTLTYDQFTFWIDPSVKPEWATEGVVYDNIPDVEITLRASDWPGISKEKNIVSCGHYNLIVWGCGLTPDFMFPVVDISRPTPNTATECLTYCNTIGYKTIKLGYLNSPTEEYLVCKFKQHTSTDRQTILNKINKDAHGMMIYPPNVQIAYFATDTNNVLNASSFRIAYIPGLVKVIRAVTIIMGIFIGILCILICGIIIKRYVENNRINIGIMRANGISKWKIVLSLLPFAFLPSLIGGIAAYLIGFFLQAPALLLFSNYWMLPTPLLSFSIGPFLGCIFLPFFLFTAISSIATLAVLKTKAVDLMKAGSEFKTNAFSRIVKKPFKHFGILTRFRVSLAFNSLLRLSMLAIMSTLTMSSLVFSMTTFDRLSQSQVINSSQFEYNFSLELVTPTSTGGPYATFNVNQGQTGNANFREYLYNTQWDFGDDEPYYNPSLTKPYQNIQYQTMATLWGSNIYKDVSGQKGLLQFPNMADATGQEKDLTYLKNRINSRLLLDYNIGVGSLSSNPWEIALALMPANSRNIAADAYNEIINIAGGLVYDANAKFFAKLRENVPASYLDEEHGVVYNGTVYPNWTEYVVAAREEVGKWATTTYCEPALGSPYWTTFRPFFTKHVDGDKTTYTLNSDISVVGYLFSQFHPSYIKLLNTIYSDLDLMQKEYPISYGMVPLNYDNIVGGKADETYTYVKGPITNIITRPSQKIDQTHEIKIEGIAPNSRFIKLTDNKGRNLNQVLYDEAEKKDSYPIIINAYVAHKYRFGVGDQFSVTASNDVDRYLRKAHKDQYENDKSNEAIFRVVGVSRGTNDEAFYTTQKIANDILGLPNGTTWNKTHNYMLWTDSEKLNQQWGANNRPGVVDLSNVPNVGVERTATYTFEGSEPILTTVPRFNYFVPTGFNGVYTQNEFGKPVTSMLPLYSYSNLYPGISVFNSDKMKAILSFESNLAIANFMSGIQKPEYYVLNPSAGLIESFITDIVGLYGETTMIGTLSGAMDVAASDKVYSNLISTFNLAEAAAIAIIIPITIIIVGIISNLIINDSKKMAAMLKALGYGDSKNAMSILALFIPTIALGLLLAIPVSFGLVAGYQAIIFSTANILVDVTQKWWYYVVAVCGIGAILVGTYAAGFVSLKKDRLVDQIK